LVKGKPWEINEVRQLTQLVEEGKSIEEISKIMVKTLDSIRQKVFDLDLKVKIVKEKRQPVFPQKKHGFFSSKLELPADLPTVEEALQILAAALRKGAEAGLSKDEVGRLQVVATLAKTYKELFADYVDYRGIEAELVDLSEKYEVLAKKTANVAS
jgi:hypothetical protein